MTSTPFEIRQLDHLVLRVTDLQRSLDFYQGVLGCELERQLEDLGLYQLRAGDQLIDLVLLGTTLGGDQAVDQARANQDHFCLTISPFDQADLQAWLAQHDITPSAVAERYGAQGYGLSLYIKDPDGNTVELKATAHSV